MRIAIVTDWFPPRQGGIESQLATLAERLAQRGHQVTVITSTPGPLTATGYTVRRIDGPRLPVTGVSASPALPWALRAALGDRFDVVHAHVSVVSPVGYLAARAAVSQGMAAVVTFHSVLRLKRLALSAANAMWRLDKRPLIWTAVSEAVALQARAALGGAVNVGVLPNGIDLDFWRDGVPRATDDGNPVTFVSAMRLHRKKRPRALVAAFREAVALVDRPARLVLAGVGTEVPALRRDIARTPVASVELVGWQGKASLRDLYRESDAFVLPTRHEAFGIAALEARAAGLPVIAARSAGCREFLTHEHDALLCESDADLTAAMVRIIREPVLRRRLARPGDRLDRYDWEAVLAEHERVYDLARRVSARALAPAVAPA